MLLSPHLIENQESVDIHVDDHNASDHYVISVSLKTESTNMEKDNLSKYKTLKYMWNNADIYGYAKVLGEHLSTVVLPKTALTCNASCRNGCVASIDRYYNSIVQCLLSASNSCIPIKKLDLRTLVVLRWGS